MKCHLQPPFIKVRKILDTTWNYLEYIYVLGKHFARLDGNLDNLNDTMKYFYHTDHLGSTVAVTDRVGNTVWDGEYTPFGKQVGQTGVLKRAAKFTGKDLDEDIGLYYFNARWYDQEIGRFISEDPIYDPNNPNLYAYCANNPLKFTDLSGKNIDRRVEELLSKQDDDLANVDVSRREAFFVKQLYDTKDISAKDAVKILNVLKEKGKITNQDLRKLGFDAKNEAGDRITLMYKLAQFETSIKEIEHLESEQRSNDLIFVFALLKGSSSTKSVTINGRKFTEKDVKALSSSVKGTSSIYLNYAKQATKNPNSMEVVLGKYNQGGVSYKKVAEKRGSTYFQIDNWDDVVKHVGEKNIWKINEAFIRQQAETGKTFILSHDPAKATGYFAKEVNLLSDMGYSFVKEGSVWRAIK